MAKALGTTPEEEHKPGLHAVGRVRLPDDNYLSFEELTTAPYLT